MKRDDAVAKRRITHVLRDSLAKQHRRGGTSSGGDDWGWWVVVDGDGDSDEIHPCGRRIFSWCPNLWEWSCKRTKRSKIQNVAGNRSDNILSERVTKKKVEKRRNRRATAMTTKVFGFSMIGQYENFQFCLSVVVFVGTVVVMQSFNCTSNTSRCVSTKQNRHLFFDDAHRKGCKRCCLMFRYIDAKKLIEWCIQHETKQASEISRYAEH